MTELKTMSNENWTGSQAIGVALVSFVLGVGGGWFIRKSQAPATAAAVVATAAQPAVSSAAALPARPPQEDLKKAAESEAAPLLAQLKTQPDTADLLVEIANLYYDAQEYPVAIEYYERSLKLQPANTGARTDMGTAYWYSGNADAAIAEFNKSLSYDPTKANTLFNLGIVKWQGKHDSAGALAAWQKLLAANPNYENREKVQQLIAEVKQ